MFLSIFSNLQQLQEEESFLNKTLHIRTIFKGENIDELFENCLDELKYYAIPTGSELEEYYADTAPMYSNLDENFIDSFARIADDSFFSFEIESQRIKQFNQILKENAVLISFYAIKFLKCQNSYESFQTIIKNSENKSDIDYYTTDLRKKRAHKAFENSLQPSFLNDFILKRYKNGEQQINLFCSDLSLQLILNHQKKFSHNKREDYDKTYDFTLFDLERYLNKLKPNTEWDARQKNKQKNLIRDIVHGLIDIHLSWNPHTTNKFEQILYFYRKELIFHCHSFLNFIAYLKRNSITYELEMFPDERSRISFAINPLFLGNSNTENMSDWIHMLSNFCSMPIVHKLTKMFTLNPYFLTEDAHSTIYIRLPILYKTFFLISLNHYGSLELMENELTSYIEKSNLFQSFRCEQPKLVTEQQLDDLLSDFTGNDAHLLKELEESILSIYSPATPFLLYKDFKPNIAYTDELSKEAIAAAYTMITMQKLHSDKQI